VLLLITMQVQSYLFFIIQQHSNFGEAQIRKPYV